MRNVIVRISFVLLALMFPIFLCASEEDPGVALEVGINTHYESGAVLDRIPEMRIGWARTGVDWADVEPVLETPPRYEWDLADAIVAEHKARGTKILWLVSGTPSWASSNGGRNGTLKDALARERFREFVRAVAERYAGEVRHFEIWPESNLERFWMGTVAEYVNDILIPACEEIKRVDPENKVIGPGLALLHDSARIKVDDFFEELKRYGAYRYLDVVSQHIYEDKPSDIIRQFEDGSYECIWFVCWKKRDALLSIYREAGLGNHPVWITEFGWKSNEVGEERQGAYLLETLRLLAGRSVFHAAFIYELQDDARYSERYGVLHSDATPKVAYEILKHRDLRAADPVPKEGEQCDRQFGFGGCLGPRENDPFP